MNEQPACSAAPTGIWEVSGAGMEIIDSHHHLWDTRALDYPEFAGNEDLDRPFLAADYDAAATACGVTASICVEAASAGAPGASETQWLLRETACSQLIAGVVAWAPVEDLGIAPYLARLLAFAGPGQAAGPPVVGIRRGFETARPEFLLMPEVVAGVRAVGAAGLPFDLLVSAAQMPAAAELVRLCPGTRFVIDHVGAPPRGEAATRRWRVALARLAQCARVACKLSGLPAAAAGGWQPADIAARLEVALALFGSDRVLFGSDWPVSTSAGSAGLASWLATVTAALGSLAAAERADALGANARRIYGLGEPPGGNRHQRRLACHGTTTRGRALG